MTEVRKVRQMIEQRRAIAQQRAKAETARLFFSPDKHLPRMPRVKMTRYVE